MLRTAIKILKQLGYRERQEWEAYGNTELEFPGCTLIVNDDLKTFDVSMIDAPTEQSIRWFFEHAGFVYIDEEKYDYCPRLKIGAFTVFVHAYARSFKITTFGASNESVVFGLRNDGP